MTDKYKEKDIFNPNDNSNFTKKIFLKIQRRGKNNKARVEPQVCEKDFFSRIGIHDQLLMKGGMTRTT